MKNIFHSLVKKRVLLLILIFGAMLRIASLISNIQNNYAVFHSNIELINQQINSHDSPFKHLFGAEISNVAYSIVCKGEGFSDPFGGHTGATGWVAPGMVFIYALSFYLFGCFTFGSIMFVFLFSLALSLIMILIIYRLCVELFKNEIIGYIGAFLFAIDPQDLFIFNRFHHQEFNAFAFLFLLTFYLFIRCIESTSIKTVFFVAMASGIAALFNPSFVIPIILVLFFFLRHNIFKLKHAVLFVIIACLIVTPYILYQKHNIKTWVFIRSNAPFEIYQGNLPDFCGAYDFDFLKKHHPILNQKEYEEYKVKGEFAYIDSKFIQFKDSFDIRKFILLCIKKFLFFFFVYHPVKVLEQGVAPHVYLVYSLRGLSLLIYLLIRARGITTYDKLLYLYIISFSIPYCFAGVTYRYSFPIVPFTAVLAAYSIYTIWHWVKRGTVNNKYMNA